MRRKLLRFLRKKERKKNKKCNFYYCSKSAATACARPCLTSGLLVKLKPRISFYWTTIGVLASVLTILITTDLTKQPYHTVLQSVAAVNDQERRSWPCHQWSHTQVEDDGAVARATAYNIHSIQHNLRVLPNRYNSRVAFTHGELRVPKSLQPTVL